MKQKSLALGSTFIFAFFSIFALFWYLGSATAVSAADLTVTKPVDTNDGVCDSDCSLREAIDVAANGDVIIIPANTYTLTMGELELNSLDITLRGDDPNTTILTTDIISRLIYIEGGNVTIENLTLTKGHYAQGAGIFSVLANVTLSNTVLISNTATDEGGGIYFDDDDYTLTMTHNTQIISNTAANAGGGIFVQNGTVNMEDGNVSYNIGGEGGGVYLKYNAILNLNDGEISHNQSTFVDFNGNVFFPGGGIHIDSGLANLNGGQIIYNSSYRGAGVMVRAGEAIQNGTLISDNIATYGGGVYVAEQQAIFTQLSGNIQNNQATGIDYGGGGLYIFTGVANLFGGQVTNNVSQNDGGGMEVRFGHLNLSGGTITDNEAMNRGGGIFNSGGHITVTNGIIQNNQANIGGGIATEVDEDGVSQNTISNSAILSNTAANENGGAINNKGNLILTNVTIHGNDADRGAGIYNSESDFDFWGIDLGGTISLTNVTIAYNDAITSGGGLQSVSGTLSIANSIVFSNTAAADNDCSGTITSLDYNLTGCSLGGSNDISSNPQLLPLDFNGGTTLNHALDTGSPAINAGNPALCPTTDQRGNPRPIGGICDIGAFEDGVGYFVKDASITETESTISVLVTVERSYTTASSNVDFSLTSNSALSSIDYTDTSGTLNFGSGVVSQTIQVDILGDTLDEFDETFTVTLSSPSAGTSIGDGEAIVTIIDNDAEPTVSINDVSVTELNAGTTAATFDVTLNAASSKPITIAYATNNATAVFNSDYITNSGTVSFDPGQTAKTVTIDVVGDTLDEIDETYEVNLSTVANGNVTIGDGQGIGTIEDDDDPPTITIDNTAVTEVNNGSSNTAAFTVTLSAPSGKMVSIDYADTLTGTATSGTDYVTISNGQLIFSPGETEKTINVTVNGDNLYEGNETFAIELSSAINATNGASMLGTATIEDNDTQPTVTINNTAVTEVDNGSSNIATFTITLSNPSVETISVDFADTLTGTATSGTDYTTISNGQLTFNSGETEKTINVTVNGDDIYEGNETLAIELSSPVNASNGASMLGTATIEDNETQPTITLQSTNSIEEGDSGTKSLEFTVTLSGQAEGTVTVNYSTSHGTADGSDYVPVTNGTVTFNSLDTSETISITINGDEDSENDETFEINLSSPSNATINSGQAIGTIIDDDGYFIFLPMVVKP